MSLLGAFVIFFTQSALQFCVNAADVALDTIDGIMLYKLSESSASDIDEWIEGALTENAGIASEWYVIGLSQYGDYDFSKYRAALLEYLENNTEGSASSRQKYALALVAASSTDSYINEVLDDSIGKQGIISWIFGLHLLNNGYESQEYSLQQIKEKLVSLQLPDGGFAVMGSNSEVDATAMALAALAPYYDSDSDVKICVDKALDFLSQQQNDTGDYSSYGTDNSESTAQVLIALSSLGIDALQDSRFIKNGNTVFDGIMLYCLPDGSFSHIKGGESNDLSTVQVFLSMVSYLRMNNAESSLYILDSINPKSENSVGNSESESYSDSSIVVTEESLVRENESASLSGNSVNTSISEKAGSYKLWVILVIAAIATAVCLAMYVFKRRNLKNFAVVIIIALACIAFVLLTDFKSRDEFYNVASDKAEADGSVIISIRCDEIEDKSAEHIPDDGTILDDTELEFSSGNTVYDILLQATIENGIHLETSSVGSSVYVEGIANIYEFDFGELSGWMYYVNGEEPSVGCGDCKVNSGDVIEWVYTCDFGKNG